MPKPLTEGQIYKFGEEPTIYAQTPEGVLKGFRTPEELARYGKIWQEAEPLSLEEKPQYTIGSPFYGAPTTPPSPTITPDALAPATPIDLTEAPQDVVDQGAVAVAAAEETAKQAEVAAKAEEEAAAAQQAKVEDITGLLKGLEEEPAERLAREEEVGIPEFKRQQADVQGQISIKTAEYRQMEAQQEAALTAAGEPGMLQTHFLGQQAQIRREFRSQMNLKASELGLLQAQSLAISGQQVAAQAAVDSAINVKYNTKKLELDTQKFLLGIISADLTAVEQKQWDIQQAEIARQEAELEEQKARDKDIENIALTAIVNGATPDVVEQIRQAEDVISATQIAQPYLVEPVEPDLLSPTEAATLGVAFGTTRAQAAAMGITPARWKPTAPAPLPAVAPLSEAEFKADFRRTYSEERKATPLESTVETAWQEYSKPEVEEPFPEMRAAATGYLQASPEEQDRFIPTKADLPEFWSEVDYLQSQAPVEAKAEEAGDAMIQYQQDKAAGMPLEDALDFYGTELGVDWVNNDYKGFLRKAGEFVLGKITPRFLR